MSEFSAAVSFTEIIGFVMMGRTLLKQLTDKEPREIMVHLIKCRWIICSTLIITDV